METFAIANKSNTKTVILASGKKITVTDLVISHLKTTSVPPVIKDFK